MNRILHQNQLKIFIVLYLGYGSYVLNRKSVSSVLPVIVENFLINKSDAGVIISCQYIAYAISQFIGGILSDRLSSKILFSFGLFFSGLATILFSLSTNSLWILSCLWFFNGFAQGFGWPSLAKLIRKWFTKQQLGTFWSLLSSSSNLAGSLSPFLSSIITLNFSWRTTLLLFGSVSILMSLIAFFLIINHPEDVGLSIILNDDEDFKRKQSKNDEKHHHQNQDLKMTWIDVIKNPLLWIISFSYMVTYAGKTSSYDWAQLYLLYEKQQSLFVATLFTSTVEFGGLFGAIMAGYITDMFLKKQTNLTNNRTISKSNDRLPLAILMVMMASLSLHSLCFYVDRTSSNYFIILIAFFLGISLYGPIAIFGVISTELAPTNLSGTSYAVASLAANIGAIISGYPFNLLAKHYGWHCVFILLECLTTITVLLLIIFYKNASIEKNEEKINLKKD